MWWKNILKLKTQQIYSALENINFCHTGNKCGTFEDT